MKKHPHYTETERQHHLEKLKESKAGLVAYSLSSGISLSCLRYWVYSRYKGKDQKEQKPANFLPVNILEGEPDPVEIVLEYPKGIRMIIRGAVSASYLKSLIG